MSVHPLSTVLPDLLLWQIQSAVILLPLESKLSLRFDTIFNFISYGVLMNYQTNIALVFFTCPVYCPYLCLQVVLLSVSAHLTVD